MHVDCGHVNELEAGSGAYSMSSDLKASFHSTMANLGKVNVGKEKDSRDRSKGNSKSQNREVEQVDSRLGDSRDQHAGIPHSAMIALDVEALIAQHAIDQMRRNDQVNRLPTGAIPTAKNLQKATKAPQPAEVKAADNSQFQSNLAALQ